VHVTVAVVRGGDALLVRALAERAAEAAPTAQAHEALVAELVARAGGRTEPLERARVLVAGCIHSMRGDPATAARALRLLVAALDEASGPDGPGYADEDLHREEAS
jgi:hypothetical protein